VLNVCERALNRLPFPAWSEKSRRERAVHDQHERMSRRSKPGGIGQTRENVALAIPICAPGGRGCRGLESQAVGNPRPHGDYTCKTRRSLALSLGIVAPRTTVPRFYREAVIVTSSDRNDIGQPGGTMDVRQTPSRSVLSTPGHKQCRCFNARLWLPPAVTAAHMGKSGRDIGLA